MDGRGNERGFDQSFATAVRGNYPGFAIYFLLKDSDEENHKVTIESSLCMFIFIEVCLILL